MKFYLLSDNTDTQMGLRLVGIEGEVLHDRVSLIASLNRILINPEVSIVLITNKLLQLAPDVISEVKLKHKHHIILEIPDRRGNSKLGESIDAYISEAIGVKLT